jgi:protein-tyrosine phosphatase
MAFPFFSKAKKPLFSLLENGFHDIHSHLIFGIDDGAKTKDDSLALARQLAGFGFSSFTGTPHTIADVWPNSRDTITNQAGKTAAALSEGGMPHPFRFASEYMLDNHFAWLVQHEPLLTLKDKLVLVEMSYINPPINLYDLLFDLQVAGYKPVLAHPERYTFYHGNPEAYKKLKKAGCLFQLNLLSTVGYYGTGVLKTAKELLKDGLFDYAGSDVHHTKHAASFGLPLELKTAEADAVRQLVRNNDFFA